MENRNFKRYNCDLAELQKSIGKYFIGKCYRVTNFHKDTIYLIQAFKEPMANNAIFSKITGNPANFDVSLGYGEKIKSIQKLPSFDDIPFQTKLLVGEPMLEKNFWKHVTTQADLKRNTYSVANVTTPHLSPVWREREIIKEIEVIYCRYCGVKNNARMTTCTQCGANLR